MGQQQLLLLVLGIVIVGLAVVVGIQAFSENQKKANADALVNDAVRIASDLQAWMLKPAAFGGGDNKGDWSQASFAKIGYQTGTVTGCSGYGNLNGCFTLAPAADSVGIIAVSAANGNEVKVGVSGTTPDDITTTINTNYSTGG